MKILLKGEMPSKLHIALLKADSLDFHEIPYRRAYFGTIEDMGVSELIQILSDMNLKFIRKLNVIEIQGKTLSD